MNKSPGDGATPATIGTHPTFRAEKAIFLFLSAIILVTWTYVSLYLLPMLLWPWVNEVWWHWLPYILGFAILVAVPLPVAMGIISVTKERPRTKRLFWMKATGLLVSLVLALLLLWAFLPSGSWWVNWYWWIWGVLAIALSILGVGARMFTVVQRVATRQERDTFAREWRFNQGDVNSTPALGIAMSGGGIRSAAFNLGVLQALHENDILRLVDVMSAVSGGSYIMSWYLLQPFYAAEAALRENSKFELSEIIDEMFDTNGRFQVYLRTKPQVIDELQVGVLAVLGATFFQPFRTFFSIGDDLDAFNSIGMTSKSYREGIQKLFHGHPRKDSTQKIDNAIMMGWNQRHADTDFTRVTPVTYRELAKFAHENNLPFFIFNCAALVDRSFRHMLWPTAFELTADDLGADLCGYRCWEDIAESQSDERRSRLTIRESLPKLLRNLEHNEEVKVSGRWVHLVNLAPAISGAAIGLAHFDRKKKARSMKFATWMPFIGNIDLGYLFPRKILNSESAVYVSDGGHAENLGAYALIRRKCRTIIVVDAEHENGLPYVFHGYRKLRNRLKEEQSMLLQVDVIDAYLEDKPTCLPPSVMTGKVIPASDLDPDELSLSVVYIKLGLHKERLDSFPPEVQAYAQKNALFPQDPTTDQSFTSEQFTAYQALGRHMGKAAAASVRSLL